MWLLNLSGCSGVFSMLSSQAFGMKIVASEGDGKKRGYLDGDCDVVQSGLTTVQYRVRPKKKAFREIANSLGFM